MGIFDTVKIENSTVLKKDGMKIEAFIAGVNSGVYGLPFVIRVTTWASTVFGYKHIVDK